MHQAQIDKDLRINAESFHPTSLLAVTMKRAADEIERIQSENAKLREQVAELTKDKERIEWLAQCTGGEWDKMNSARLNNSRQMFRVVVDIAISQSK